MNKRKIGIVVLFFFLVSVFDVVPIESGYRDYYFIRSEEILLNITATNDDVMIYYPIGFWYNESVVIRMKQGISDTRVGLKFNFPYFPLNNGSHIQYITHAYIEVYSDYQYDLQQEGNRLTIYTERGNDDIQSFINYTDVRGRVLSSNYRNWDINDVGYGDWFQSPNLHILVKDALEWDNDTVAFLLESTVGDLRLFTSYDGNVSLAPRLRINYEIWEHITGSSPPTGYDNYMETYRGYRIWNTTSNDEWFNYSALQVNDANNRIKSISDTLVKTNYVRDEDSISMKQNTSSEMFDGTEFNVKFGITVNNISDPNPAEAGVQTYVFAYLNYSESVLGRLHSIDAEGEGGILLGLEFTTASSQVRFAFQSWEHKLGAGNQEATNGFDSMWFTSAQLPITMWFDIYYVEATGYYEIYMFNDQDMTSLNASKQATFQQVAGYGVVNDNLNHTHAIIGSINPQDPHDNDRVSYEHHSELPEIDFVVTDDNNTIISPNPIGDFDNDGDEDINDVYEWIDHYLGTGQEINREWLGDYILVLIGLSGFAMIPLSIILCGFAFQSGDYIDGLKILVMMFFVGIGCITVWLWG